MMLSEKTSHTRSDADGDIQSLLKRAFSQGRSNLDAEELGWLLGRLGLAEVEPAVEPGRVQVNVSLSRTREFGMVMSAGVGGSDAALPADNFGPDRAAVHAAIELTDGAAFLEQFKRTLAYQRLAVAAERQQQAVPDESLRLLFERLLSLAADQQQGEEGDPVLEGLELSLFERDGALVANRVACRFQARTAGRQPRPLHKIEKLIHPRSIGVIGVSASKMNFGRIILRNLVGSGYSPDDMVVIKPGDDAMVDGVRCVESLGDLDHKLDLLIVAVSAQAVYGLVDDILETDAVESVMLIPGSLGETQESRQPAAELAEKINEAHAREGGGPIFLGANCLGVVSHAGGYDSWFIPLERLPKPQKKSVRNSVMLSQSGAFMITRLSQNVWLDPAYMIALGNQTDLTHGDMLGYFSQAPDIDVIGVYIEGFRDLDGRDFARAVRRATLNGKQVVVYKAGRTSAGAAGVMGHTASIAGDPTLFTSVLRQAGALVAEDVNRFDDLFYIAGTLSGKEITGNRLGAISGAGFEAVGMADSTVTDAFRLEMGELGSETVQEVTSILDAKRLSALVEVRNPIDINPGADDEAHLQITEAFARDPDIDAVVVGLDPTAPSVRALESSQLRPGYDLHDAQSTVQLMPPMAKRLSKPVVGIIDGGRLYDAMADALMDQGVCVFRNCARGTRALTDYIGARIQARDLQHRHANDTVPPCPSTQHHSEEIP